MFRQLKKYVKKLYRHIFLILISCKAFASYSQGYFITRPLLDSAAIENNQIIILKETGSFIIVAPFKKFTDGLKYDEKDKKLLLLFEKKAAAVLHADSIVKKAALKSKLANKTAALLHSGNCLVYNKLSKRAEKTVTVEKYLSGNTKGKRFKTEDGLILLETKNE